MHPRRLIALCLLSLAPMLAGAAEVPYPDGFRNWQHVKSMILKPGHPLYEAVGGMHHIYGNKKAIRGYQANRFADGSVIVFDLFEAVDKDNAISEGARKAVVVMARDRAKFKATDGWGYQVFDAKTRKGSLDGKGQADCHACHLSQKAQDFVFSRLRD